MSLRSQTGTRVAPDGRLLVLHEARGEQGDRAVGTGDRFAGRSHADLAAQRNHFEKRTLAKAGSRRSLGDADRAGDGLAEEGLAGCRR